MSFKDLMAQHLDGIRDGPLGTTIKYRRHPGPFRFVKAIVDDVIPEPQADGRSLRNTVQVVISRSDVPWVQVGKDQIMLPSDGPDFPERIFAIREIVSKSAAGLVLKCIE